MKMLALMVQAAAQITIMLRMMAPLGPKAVRITVGRDRVALAHAVEPEHIQIGEIDQHIEHRHDRGADQQDADHVALDVLQVGGKIGGLVPAAIGEQDQHHREPERAEARRLPKPRPPAQRRRHR